MIMKKQRLFAVASIIFLASVSWYLIISQGLPAGDLDDWNHILRSEDRKWSTDLIPNLIRPWSKSKFWTGQIDRSYHRIGHDSSLKLVASSKLGDNDFAYYLISKAPFFAGTITIFFILCYFLTQSFRYALPGTLFFLLVPAQYAHILWLSDATTLANFCTILSFLFAFLTFENIRQKHSPSSFMLILFATHFVAWFGIRTKESSLIVPLVMGSYGILKLHTWRTEKFKLFLLFLSAAHLVFLIVPIEQLSSHPTVGTVPFQWNHISRMVLKNYSTGYEPEPTSAFFSAAQIWPSSIARTFGFFFLWTIVIHIAIYLINKKRDSGNISSILSKSPLVVLLSIWIFLEIPLMGRFQADPRYFCGTMVPLSLLATRIIQCAHETSVIFLKRILIAISLFSFIWTVPYVNLQHTIWLRLQIGQKFNYFIETAKTIHADLFPTDKAGLREIGRFYCSTCAPGKKNQPKIENYLYYCELPFDGWGKDKSGSIEQFRHFAEKGYIYYVAYQLPTALLKHSNIEYVALINGKNSGSFFEKFLYSIKKKSPSTLHILKWRNVQSRFPNAVEQFVKD